MHSITSILVTMAGVAALSLLGFVTLSLAMVIGVLVSITLMARAMMPAREAQPVRVKTHQGRQPRERAVTRVWNDGKGTIIDM